MLLEPEDADVARAMVKAGAEYLLYVDGYTPDDLEQHVFAPILEDARRES